LLHPQTHNAPATSIPVYVVRPLFPFYPPITQGFRSAEELRTRLQALGAPPLPEIWEKRILEFSKAAKHKAYCVPREFHEITEMFGDLYRPENKDPATNLAARRALAEKSAKQAAEWLPSGAFLNGISDDISLTVAYPQVCTQPAISVGLRTSNAPAIP
jgi:hypothetical protein